MQSAEIRAEKIYFVCCRKPPSAKKYKIYFVPAGKSKEIYFLVCSRKRRRVDIFSTSFKTTCGKKLENLSCSRRKKHESRFSTLPAKKTGR